jgi:hypothetical protein
MKGKIISRKEEAPGEVISLPTSDLPSGVYFQKAVYDYSNSNSYINLQSYKTVIAEHQFFYQSFISFVACKGFYCAFVILYI